MDATTSIAISQIFNLSQGLATVNLGYLAISVTIIALLGGSFYLFNVKPLQDILSKQEEALKNLRTEVRETITKAEESLNTKIDSFKKEYSEQLTIVMKQREETIVSDIRSRIAVLDKELSQKIDTVSKEKDDSLKTVVLSEFSNKMHLLEKHLGDDFDKHKKSNDENISFLKTQLSDLKIDVRDLEAFKYHSEGRMGGVLVLFDVLEDHIDHKPHLLKYDLERLKERISEYPLDKKQADKLKTLLKKIKDKECAELIGDIEKSIKVKEGE